MKVLSILALTAATATAFAPCAPAFARTAALRISKEEDLELTRKVIQGFVESQDGDAPAAAEESPPAEEKKEVVAAAAEE